MEKQVDLLESFPAFVLHGGCVLKLGLEDDCSARCRPEGHDMGTGSRMNGCSGMPSPPFQALKGAHEEEIGHREAHWRVNRRRWCLLGLEEDEVAW
jgi:hypothetical protein